MTEAEWLACDDLARMLDFIMGVVSRVHDSVNVDLSKCRISDRKLRLFACGCCRLAWDRLTDDAQCGECCGRGGHDWYPEDDPTNSRLEGGVWMNCPNCSGTGRVNRSRRAVEVAEEYADGRATGDELSKACLDVRHAWEGEDNPAGLARYAAHDNPAYAATRVTRPGLVGISPAAQAALLRCVAGNPFRLVKLGCSRGPAECPAHAPDWLTPTVLGMVRAIYDDRGWDAPPFLADALEDAGCADAELLAHLRGLARCPSCLENPGRQVTEEGEFGCMTCQPAGAYWGKGWVPAGPPCPRCGGAGEVTDDNGGNVGVVKWCPGCSGTGRLPAVHTRGCWALDLVLGKE